MKSRVLVAMLAVIMAAALSVIPVAASSTGYIAFNGVKLDKPLSEKAEGHIKISGSTTKRAIMLLVSGMGKEVWYEVKLDKGAFAEEIWFDSRGEYTIQVMVNEYDRKYSYGPSIKVENTQEMNEYLNPAKFIESNEAAIITAAKEITKDCSSDLERIKAIYDWVEENIKYDYEKLSKHNKGQYDNQYGALYTIKTKSGVCYDYSTLVAALARSLGIQAKVVEGNLKQGKKKELHAWNEVYISELDNWISIDATLGSTTGEDYFDFSKDSEKYIAYEYK